MNTFTARQIAAALRKNEPACWKELEMMPRSAAGYPASES